MFRQVHNAPEESVPLMAILVPVDSTDDTALGEGRRVRIVLNGATDITAVIQEVAPSTSPPEDGANAAPEPLSRRERDVLRLLATGLSNSEIAHSLTIAVNTVKMHVKNIYAKLGVRNRAQATIRARQLQLV
jgi:ATP/maltotriose-dependent transcriptional regulator MalT